MIKTLQSNIVPSFSFEVDANEVNNIKGGELLTFDTTVLSARDLRTTEVYNSDFKVILKRADGYSTAPIFLAGPDNVDRAYSGPAIELNSQFSSNNLFANAQDSSGKLSVFSQEGLFLVSSDVFEADIDATTELKTRLYVSANGLLTSEESPSGLVVATMIEYRLSTDSILTNRFAITKSFFESDSILIYKLATVI